MVLWQVKDRMLPKVEQEGDGAIASVGVNAQGEALALGGGRRSAVTGRDRPAKTAKISH